MIKSFLKKFRKYPRMCKRLWQTWSILKSSLNLSPKQSYRHQAIVEPKYGDSTFCWIFKVRCQLRFPLCIVFRKYLCWLIFFLLFHWHLVKYSPRRLIGSQIIKFAAFCNTQNTPVYWISRLLLSLLWWPC